MFAVALLALSGCATTNTRPGGSAPKPQRNPYTPASPALLARMGCDQKPALLEPERLRFTYIVEVGQDACVALARYGQPHSADFSSFGPFDSALLMWTNIVPGRLSSVAAHNWKDTPG